MSQTQQQLITSGSILSITLFEQKLMRNFAILNNRIKKLQSLNEIQSKTRNIQKQLKFITTKVDSIVQKIPKDGNTLSKRQIISLIKDQTIDFFNNAQDKLKQTQTFKSIQNQLEKFKTQIKNIPKHQSNNQNAGKQANKQTSFTAGTILLSQKKNVHASQQLLNQVLTKEQNKIVSQILSSQQQINQFQKVKQDIQNLYDILDNLKISMGRNNAVMKQINEFDKYQGQNYSKSQQKKRKRKSPNKNGQQQQGQNQDSKNNQLSKKGQLSVQMERNQNRNKLQSSINGKSQIIVKQDFISRKGLGQQFNQQIKTQNTLLNKDQLSGVFVNGPSGQKSHFSNTHQHFNKLGELTKIEYIPQNKLLSKAQRSKSLKKLQRIQKKLRVDDIKDINTVLKEIQLRLQNKTNFDTFSQYVKEFQQKLQILRITKDQSNQINDIRKMVYSLDNKIQSIITYIQSLATEDDALIVKKNWTCISCDKMIQKFNGKIGQHVNWDSVQAKKLSPAKIGAFGQAGQLATKIKSLMQNSIGE